MTATVDGRTGLDRELDTGLDPAPDTGLLTDPALADEAGLALPPDNGDTGQEDEGLQPAIRTTPLAIAAGLSGLAPAWLVARLFRGGLAPLIPCVLGVVIGAGLTWYSYRTRRASLIQCLVVPVSAAVGAALVAPSATGGSANLPSLVVEALRSGGLRQAPVPFDPGWRFLCVVVLAVTVAAAMAVAASANRPQLVAVVPLPLTAGAALIQPKGAEVASSAVAIVFVIGGLMVGYGAALGGEEGLGGRFEVRRLVRGAALIGCVVLALVVLAQTSFLFPASNRNQVIPPQKPPPPQPLADRELFTVRSPGVGPWRVGTLDVYQNNAWYLPSVDPRRVKLVPKSGEVEPPGRPTYASAFVIKDLPGHLIPTPEGPAAVTGSHNQLDFDPRTEVLKLHNTRIPAGMSYTVTAVVPPDAKQMAAAPPAAPDVAKEFEAVPPAPPGVRGLLASLPASISDFDRLQAVRQALYNKVVAAGSGKPVDVPPARVDAMLAGGEASPYEITAAEALLARWAGIPARIGFGFYGGDRSGDTVSFRPRDGAAWLEAYFQGYGWVAIVGTPPRAKASISPDQKKNEPQVVSTDELALTIYVPIREPNIQLLFQVVRYWLLRLVPIGLAVLAVAIGYPGVLKLLRRRRRRRWALTRVPSARIVVAYAELRDLAYDFNIGDSRATPIEFLDAVADDDEHTELAWLVTRALWGDLARDLRSEDVQAAEEMAVSVRRRLAREQTGINRALAWISRASLRDAYTDQIPNLWPRARVPGLPERSRRRGRRRLAAAAAAAGLLSGSCAAQSSAKVTDLSYPAPLMPARAGAYVLAPEPKLETNYARAKTDAMVTGGHVYTVRSGTEIQGSIQIALFKPGVNLRNRSLQKEVEGGLGAGVAVTHHYGLAQVRALTLPEQQMFLWFPPDHNVMELFVMRKNFTDAERVVDDVIAYQRGLPAPDTVS